MDICIFGAGAIGGYMAARLIQAAEARVSVVARGAQLAAIRERGLLLHDLHEDVAAAPVAATDHPADLPPQDIVLVTLKAPSLPGSAPAIAGLLKPDGQAVFVGNGIPFWWNQGAGRSGSLPLLDPDGVLGRMIDPGRLVGGIAYSANDAVAPGIVAHTAGNRWILGRPDDSTDDRLQVLTALLGRAGIAAEGSSDIRRDVWLKLLRNAPRNPLCALTRLATGELARDAALVALADRLVDEFVGIAAAGGWDVAAAGESARIAHEPFGTDIGIRPSMLQDVLSGRGLEVDALLGQPQVFAREAGLPTPTLDMVLALLRGLDAGLRG